jgi:glycosyltransferase involved in cell wall biosynthesis
MDSGVPEERIRVIANAVSAAGDGAGMDQRTAIRARLAIGEADFVFGYVGRLSEEKGLDHLLQAAGELRVEASTSRILLVGDGPRRQDLEEAARGRGILDRVHFAGFQRDTSGWYRAMDAFVLPSLTEGTPMALLEAMAQGLPVVGTSVGGVPAVVTHGENGLLVPPADAAALGGALTQLASDVQLRRRLSAGALRTVRERYSVEAWTREVRNMYLATVQSCRRRS